MCCIIASCDVCQIQHKENSSAVYEIDTVYGYTGIINKWTQRMSDMTECLS